MSGWTGDFGVGSAGIYAKLSLQFKMTLTYNISHGQVAQSFANALTYNLSTSKVTLNLAEALVRTGGIARAGLICVTGLIPSAPRTLGSMFPQPPNSPNVPGVRQVPQLIGLGYDSFKREVQSHGKYQALSGREVRVKYYDYTVWQWDLTYTYLPDRAAPQAIGTTDSDLATLIAFFQETRGGQVPFTYWDPDDNRAENTLIATTDGQQNAFLITREYGGEWKEVEPVGWVSHKDVSPYVPIVPYPDDYPQVFLDGIFVDPSQYDLVQNELGKQIIRFKLPPAAGQRLTMTYNFLYFTRFADLMYDFEQFIGKIWDLQKLTLESLRSYVR